MKHKELLAVVAGLGCSSVVASALRGAMGLGKSERFSAPHPARVLIVMYSTPNILDPYASLAEKINEMYAKRHGYAFKHIIGRDDDTSMRPVWKKVFTVRDELENYEAVCWIDSDAIFNDHTKPLPLDVPEDFVISSDFPNGPSLVNTGIFIVKRTDFGRHFMRKWCNMLNQIGSTYNSKFPFEQGACEDLIRSMGKDSDKIRVAPAEFLNSIYGKVSRGRFAGNYIVHLMACPAHYRKAVFKRWLEINGTDAEDDE
jgi:hypothetical protein